MRISAIVAIAENYAIGKDNQLPWHLPNDLKFFMNTTMGKPVIMGRKTYDSMGKPLKGRLNIVISRQEQIALPDAVLLYNSVEAAVTRAKQEHVDELFIIGGAEIFRMALPMVERLYITVVHTEIQDADVFFPHIDHTHWKLTWEEPHPQDDRHKYAYTFQKWERINEI